MESIEPLPATAQDEYQTAPIPPQRDDSTPSDNELVDLPEILTAGIEDAEQSDAEAAAREAAETDANGMPGRPRQRSRRLEGLLFGGAAIGVLAVQGYWLHRQGALDFGQLYQETVDFLRNAADTSFADSVGGPIG